MKFLKKSPIKASFLIMLGAIMLTSTAHSQSQSSADWSVSVLPSSIRINPVTNNIIDRKADVYPSQKEMPSHVLSSNWIYDGNSVSLHGARGEYVSYQVVLTNHSEEPLRYIKVDAEPFKNEQATFEMGPELFLEWSVNVKTPSTGYPKASLGKGWYPDALIPFEYIQEDSSQINRRWIYPFWLPDFNNRIPNQKSIIVWVDQYIPFERVDVPPGTYTARVAVSVGNETKEIPVQLDVWDFAIPNENKFKASLQQGGFIKGLDEERALEIFQLFKRNRIGLLDQTFTPDLTIGEKDSVTIGWEQFDERLKKYFTGMAFTKEYGYEYGPGYGEPLEAFILPFDVYGKHGTRGWPDTGKPDVEKKPANRSIYIRTIKKVRDHLKTMADPQKTELIVYLNGLDESYFPEAWDRMAYYGKMFNTYFPATYFRIDGAYSEEAMERVHKNVDSWGAHTLNYNIDEVKEYRNKWGIEDWVYGPMIYESKVNSWVGSSTFIDLPLVNDRAISWSSWKYGTRSWLSWGIGAGWKRGWYDPESWKQSYRKGADSDSTYNFKKLNGNALLVYSPGIAPNVLGVSPSIRLKTMRDGVEEYEYFRKLSELDGDKKRANEIVNEIINQPFGEHSIGHLDVWNYNAEKWYDARLKIGNLIDKLNSDE